MQSQGGENTNLDNGELETGVTGLTLSQGSGSWSPCVSGISLGSLVNWWPTLNGMEMPLADCGGSHQKAQRNGMLEWVSCTSTENPPANSLWGEASAHFLYQADKEHTAEDGASVTQSLRHSVGLPAQAKTDSRECWYRTEVPDSSGDHRIPEYWRLAGNISHQKQDELHYSKGQPGWDGIQEA